MMFPLLLWVRINDANHHIRFFIPFLFVLLLLLPVFIIACIILPFLYLIPSKTLPARAVLRILLNIPKLLQSSRGLEIVTHSNDSDITIFIK